MQGRDGQWGKSKEVGEFIEFVELRLVSHQGEEGERLLVGELLSRLLQKIRL